MNNINQPAFNPKGNSTVNIASGASSANVQFQTSPGLSRHLRVLNTGTVTVFVEFGQSGVVASTTTSMPVLSNEVEIFGVGDCTWVAAISASSATVYFTPGEGM